MMPFDAQVVAQAAVERAASDTPEEAARPPEFSDDALALRFSARHRERLRYVSAWGRWLIREPGVWRFDETTHAFDLARHVCRQAAAECQNLKVAASIASAKTVAAVERLAKADRRHATTADAWDTDPWAPSPKWPPSRRAEAAPSGARFSAKSLPATPNWCATCNGSLATL